MRNKINNYINVRVKKEKRGKARNEQVKCFVGREF